MFWVFTETTKYIQVPSSYQNWSTCIKCLLFAPLLLSNRIWDCQRRTRYNATQCSSLHAPLRAKTFVLLTQPLCCCISGIRTWKSQWSPTSHRTELGRCRNWRMCQSSRLSAETQTSIDSIACLRNASLPLEQTFQFEIIKSWLPKQQMIQISFQW